MLNSREDEESTQKNSAQRDHRLRRSSHQKSSAGQRKRFAGIRPQPAQWLACQKPRQIQHEKTQEKQASKQRRYQARLSPEENLNAGGYEGKSRRIRPERVPWNPGGQLRHDSGNELPVGEMLNSEGDHRDCKEGHRN